MSSKGYTKTLGGIYLLETAISEEDCDWLVSSVGENWDFKSLDPVDDLPVWQTKDTGEHDCPSFLYEYAKNVCDKFLIDKICSLYRFSKAKLRGSALWPFIRRYKPKEYGRDSFKLHSDPTYFTATFLLSDPSEFSGGNFLIQPYWFLLPKAIQMKKGDCLIFKGRKRHGVSELTEGVRHSMSFFLWDRTNEYQ